MTVAELIAALQQHNLDLNVRIVIEDEVDSSPPADIYNLERIIADGEPYIEILGLYA
ncbi:hypothetical protein [Mycolicibacterium fluoranthenivorans]|uniref:Uncharacterized protein n=1 Tax=Mycolicibacterium fluoranthenivorans TaxID=258505 RepID=A0A1G4X2S0_9MYCO|nr:hypothetical protein [Mycolicibacterium fluoranthenivorans]SCX34531.1 hypothetical protein SAMN02799620_06369 [Mycolicibacterium fluoranthenivorans]